MADLLGMLQAAAGAGGEVDPNFNQTVLLLHGDGTNGAQNNTFLDSSSNGFTITRNGNTTQGTFSPFSAPDGRWSNYFDGTGDAFRASASSLSMSSFTVEAWLNYSGDANIRTFYDFANGLSGYGILAVYANTLSAIRFQFFSTNSVGSLIGNIDVTWTSYFNKWTHVACTYDGSTYRVFVNGTLAGSLSSATSVVAINHLTIGGRAETTPSQNWQGYMSNFRFVTGAALYTSDFTPSTTPLTTAGSGTTQFIFAQSNRFVDTEGNYTFTMFGNPKVTPFSPFAPTAAYSPSVNGGSGYFDGTGDYLTVANSNDFDTNSAFTIDVWFYPTATTNSPIIFSRGGGSTVSSWSTTNGAQFALYFGAGIVWQWNSSGSAPAISGGTVNLNAWNHVAVGYDGTTTRVWLNGASVNTSTSGYTMPTTRDIVRIGSWPTSTAPQPMFGYISNLRFVKNDVYGVSNTSITLPTAPTTAITDTKLLTNFTNAGIFDNTGKNNLETVGNAQIDTAVKKYGTGSMEFDGTGDYLLAAANRNNDFGTGDFTIECWIRFSVVGNGQIVSAGNGANTGAYYWQYFSSQLQFGDQNGGNILAASWSPSANTWYHLAVIRTGTTLKQFVDGTQLGTDATDGHNFVDGPTYVGFGGAGALNGFIDDLRITKGVARYTTTFTPPTKEFPNL